MKDSIIYFEAGELVAESGDARVYEFNDELFLELGQGHHLWALESELKDYIWQISDKPKGDCLEIGLGLGVASKYILSCPNVNSLTTVELNENVIKTQAIANKIDDKRHTILNCDGLLYMYNTKKLYDFIFIDCYELIDEDTLPIIADIVLAGKRILKKNGIIIGWFDEATPEEFVEPFFRLFK